MSRNVQSGPRETSADVLSYLKFAGYELTRDQLVRLHQRRLIDQPFHGMSGWRGVQTTHPAGTGERLLRIAQLKTNIKQLDELAWRLWWEGADVEPDLVRDYLVKVANRWDDRLSELRSSQTTANEETIDDGERDVLDDVFFKHLKHAPSLAPVRKRIGKDSDIYLEFAGLLIDLLRGDFSVLGQREIALFEKEHDDHAGDWSGNGEARLAGRSAVYAMQSASSLPYAQVVEALDDGQIENARAVALLFSRIIASIGEIMHDGYGAGSRGRDTVGKSLVALSESPEEQVLSLLLTSSFLKDERIRANLLEFESVVTHSAAVSFQDFLRLRYLAKELPELDLLLRPEQMREAFDSTEGAELWREGFQEFHLLHVVAMEEAMAKRPDLFGDAPPESEEMDEEPEEIGDSKKKK